MKIAQVINNATKIKPIFNNAPMTPVIDSSIAWTPPIMTIEANAVLSAKPKIYFIQSLEEREANSRRCCQHFKPTPATNKNTKIKLMISNIASPPILFAILITILLQYFQKNQYINLSILCRTIKKFILSLENNFITR